jgi:hypothetical protein
MFVESYDPAAHEAWLAACHAESGWPFVRELFSDRGFVARADDGELVACVFLYRDPSCSVVFADNVLCAKLGQPRGAFRVMAAMRALWHAIARVSKGCLVVVQTDSPFVMATLKRDRCLAQPMKTYRVSAPFFEKGV